MKHLVLSIIRKFGYDIRRWPIVQVQKYNYNEQMRQGLLRFARLALPVNTVVDVGAAQGYWTLSAKRVWQDAAYVLFEPLAERKEELDALAHSEKNLHYIPFAAGKENGFIHFSVTDDLDGSGVSDSEVATRSVPVVSIQDEIKRLGLKGPFLIKLDTHGFEVPILAGCEFIIPEVSLFIIECYGFKIAKDSLLFWEMCAHMEKLGYRLFDIVDIMRRSDNAFWQCDAFFIRADHELFMDNKYR